MRREQKWIAETPSRGPIFRSAGTGMLATQANHFSKHLEARQNTSLRVVFSTLFSFENVAKRGLSCLLHYFTTT